MKSRLLASSALVAASLLVTPASAQSVDSYISQLEAQGYTDFEISRSFLGRTVIEATDGTREREIVVSRSGDVLRDSFEASDDDSDDDDPEDDDQDDDDDDRDEDDDHGDDSDDGDDADEGDDNDDGDESDDGEDSDSDSDSDSDD